MSTLSPALRDAFRCLGVAPDADRETIRSAWRAMVRAYHPDQHRNNKAEANRRLAELNAAFDLVSAWTPEDAAAYAKARARQEAAQSAKARARARQAKDARRAEEVAAQKQRAARAAARKVAEDQARARAAELDRVDAAKRAARRRMAEPQPTKPMSPQARFLAAMDVLRGPVRRRDFGYA